MPQPTDTAPSFDVFISYSKDDLEHVTPLVVGLELRGVTVWWDRNRVLGGADIDDAVKQGLQASRALIVCFGGHGKASHWMRGELDEFIQVGNRPIIPVLLPSCPPDPDIPLFIRSFRRITMAPDGIADVVGEITNVLGIEERSSSIPELDQDGFTDLSRGVRLGDVASDELRIAIGGELRQRVHGHSAIEVDGSSVEMIHGSATRSISMSSTTTVGVAQVTTIGGACATTIGGVWTAEVGMHFALQAGLGIHLSAGATLRASGTAVEIVAGQELVLRCGPVSIRITSDGEVSLTGVRRLVGVDGSGTMPNVPPPS